MRLLCQIVLLCISTGLFMSCVDPYEPNTTNTVNVIVVDGTITNLAEQQVIRLNRSRADSLTGRFGTRPITKARVEVIVDSSQVIACHETVDGSYQLPSDFKGQVGHAYQLHFVLANGIEYRSNQQVMQAVPAIDKVSSQFNTNSIFPPIAGYYTAGHDLFIDFKDPAQTRNYYRWDWKLYEKQLWCKTCYQGQYAIYDITAELFNYPLPAGNIYTYTSGNTKLLEDCYFELTPPPPSLKNPLPEYRYDYNCRSQCWEIIYSYQINIFGDEQSNGGQIQNRNVAQIPFYDSNPGLVEIRQSSLTADAYRYLNLFQQQTQNTGGLADTPPTALIGNVHNVSNPREAVVGYFAASAVSTVRYWLDRKDVSGRSLGNSSPEGNSGVDGAELFYALNLRAPQPEPAPPYQPQMIFLYAPPRPPTAICAPSDTKTPFKPEGWRD